MRHDTATTPALGRARTALLTTFRTSGEPVATPVSVGSHAGRLHFVTAADSGKARRLARDDRVLLAPCTVTGTPLGPEVAGTARRIDLPTWPWRSVLRPTGPLFWSWLMYRLRGHRMELYEVDLGRVRPG